MGDSQKCGGLAELGLFTVTQAVSYTQVYVQATNIPSTDRRYNMDLVKNLVCTVCIGFRQLLPNQACRNKSNLNHFTFTSWSECNTIYSGDCN